MESSSSGLVYGGSFFNLDAIALLHYRPPYMGIEKRILACLHPHIWGAVKTH